MVTNLVFQADKPLNIFSKYNEEMVAGFFIINCMREKSKVDRCGIVSDSGGRVMVGPDDLEGLFQP